MLPRFVSVILAVFSVVVVGSDTSSAVCPSEGACRHNRPGRMLLQSGQLAIVGAEDASAALARDANIGQAVQEVDSHAKKKFTAAQTESTVNFRKARSVETARQVPDPDHMGDWIKDTLLPMATDTVNVITSDVERANANVDGCGASMWNVEQELEHMNEILIGDEQERFKCISEEHASHADKHKVCRQVLNFLHDIEIPTGLDEVENKSDISAIKSNLRTNAEFYTLKAAMYKNATARCRALTEASAAKDHECEVDDDVAKEFYCHMKAGNDAACASYDKCYEANATVFNTVISNSKSAEAANKEHFKAMACHQYLDTSGKMVDPCQDMDMAADTSHLDVNYPLMADRMQCVGLMKTKRDYSNVDCDAPPTPPPAPLTTAGPDGDDDDADDEVTDTTVPPTTADASPK